MASLPDAEHKTLVIRMLTEFIVYRCKIEEEVKAIQSEIKKNIQGTNSEGKETRTQMNNLEQKEEINIQLKQNEETRIQKNEERLRNHHDNFKCSNNRIIGAPEQEEEEQEMEHLLEQLMKENFPNLVKEIDFQEVQEAQRVPKKLNSRRNTPRHIIINMPKVKDKERILKAARDKQLVTYKELPQNCQLTSPEIFMKNVMKSRDLQSRLL